MSTYVLIHGAWHGGWCWDKVVPLLESKGHTVVAPDLPGHGSDKTPIGEISLKAYADHVCRVVDARSEPVFLVGHSMGGFVITQAAEQCAGKINTLVYVTAYLLENGETPAEFSKTDTDSLIPSVIEIVEDQSAARLKDEEIIPCFYGDCEKEDVNRAKSLLVPQAMAPLTTPLETTDVFGRIPRVYIECLKDRAISDYIQKKMYTRLPCKTVFSINTDHSPFFSAPEELAGHLLSL
jgi:pimeloyl-ACP methyl ester carboxylesterase